ncbi:MAG: Patatin-like phospholipase [Sphingobacteriales bacterium]|nr:Patatin-like phospholipase [Sphingobacteriales bacterium]
MDQVMDLTARAVTFIVLIQDTLILPEPIIPKKNEELIEEKIDSYSKEQKVFHDFIRSKDKILKTECFEKKAREVTWVSMEKPEDEVRAETYTFDRCEALIHWLNTEQNTPLVKKNLQSYQHYPSPSLWRETIREILYQYPEQRIELANVLHYLPLYLVLALGGAHLTAKEQRLLQIWTHNKRELELEKILSKMDMNQFDNLVQKVPVFESKEVELLISNDQFLTDRLDYKEVPLPFEYILLKELAEITKSRDYRFEELCSSANFNLSSTRDEPIETGTFERVFRIAFNYPEERKSPFINFEDKVETNSSEGAYAPDIYKRFIPANDPFTEAKRMHLWAIAFSGGGIRSATFNLGILQGLAKKGLLSKFDYLSTVSGGGYIGSWFISWIARNKSLVKVSDRLNAKKSSDPFAEEVRPIRWLRMYSNYLAPQSGIMSVDSWTVGMTIIRNMLINQLVILALILTISSVGNLLFRLWFKVDFPFQTGSAIIILIAGLLAGLGMHSYHKENFPKIPLGSNLKHKLTKVLLFVGLIFSYMSSAWIYNRAVYSPNKFQEFVPTFLSFQPILWVGFASLLLIALMGRYDKCIPEKGARKGFAIVLAILFTFLAALLGVVLLVLASQILQQIGASSNMYASKIAFTIGPPLILEVLSLTIILRMAFLGSYFPDERREWWGRMGAEAHRISLIWIIFIGFTFLGKALFDYLNEHKEGIASYFIAGGWGATVLAGIKAAFSHKTSGDKKTKGFTTSAMEILALISPYVFGLGLIILLPGIIEFIEDKLELGRSLQKGFLVTGCLLLLTLFLSWRIGVNQFSMHLFYKQRLVRAFLGATRSRTDRQKTANPYTNFDSADEICLKDFHCGKGYFGPYPIINTTINATHSSSLDRQDRKAESFIFSPFYCGFDFSLTRSLTNTVNKTYDFAYRPTKNYAYTDGGPFLGTAMGISGAAANPNQGYHSSPATSFLLSLFNVRLGWWMGNPRKSNWQSADPKFGLSYIISDLIGKSDTTNEYVCLSDGGHFDNMGLYELIRRKCRYIILSDGEQDATFSFEGLANAIRKCRIDFGVEITLDDIAGVAPTADNIYSKQHYTVGTIKYPGEEIPTGLLLYIKSSVTGHETIDIKEYATKNDGFPHQTTGDQFFDEAQFESYRKLGMCIIESLWVVHP